MKTINYSIVIPEELLSKVDGLARQEFATKAEIIRRAILQYVRENYGK